MSKLFSSAKEQQSCLTALSEQVFGKWMNFQVCHRESCRWSEILLCVKYIASWKIFEQIVTIAYLKNQQISQENTCLGVSF